MKVGVRELRANLSRYLEQVKSGAVINVTDRDRLIARLMPAKDEAPEISPRLAALIADGTVSWSGEQFKPHMPAVQLRGSRPTLAGIVSSDRD